MNIMIYPLEVSNIQREWINLIFNKNGHAIFALLYHLLTFFFCTLNSNTTTNNYPVQCKKQCNFRSFVYVWINFLIWNKILIFPNSTLLMQHRSQLFSLFLYLFVFWLYCLFKSKHICIFERQKDTIALRYLMTVEYQISCCTLIRNI